LRAHNPPVRALLALLLTLAFGAPAIAGELVVTVRLPNGAPVANAVVSLYPGGRPVPPAAPAGLYKVAQQNTQFHPFVLVVPVGATVAFPNYDSFRHHVYSFSPAKRFELKLYAREQNRTVRFDKAGVVALGCNIHDQMTAFLKVSDTALVTLTDGSGHAVFADAPPGAVAAQVWHPYLRSPANQIELRWTLGRARQAETVVVNLRPPPRPAAAY
jgi:plastocyanin